MTASTAGAPHFFVSMRSAKRRSVALASSIAASIAATVAEVDSLRANDRNNRPIFAGSRRTPSTRLMSTRRISSMEPRTAASASAGVLPRFPGQPPTRSALCHSCGQIGRLSDLASLSPDVFLPRFYLAFCNVSSMAFAMAKGRGGGWHLCMLFIMQKLSGVALDGPHRGSRVKEAPWKIPGPGSHPGTASAS